LGLVRCGPMSYDGWTVSQLKEECARRTLKTVGPKEQLVDRLEAYDQCARDVVQQRTEVIDEGALPPGSLMDESDDGSAANNGEGVGVGQTVMAAHAENPSQGVPGRGKGDH
jgi:hypothetical protein